MRKWILVGILAAVQTSLAHAQTFSSTIDGLRTGESFGIKVLGNMFLDGDGVPDFVVGAMGGYAGTTDGKVYVFSGVNLQLIRTLAGQSPPDTIAADRFGYSLGNLGDINGDGTSDILVGAPGAPSGNSRGYARFFSGDDGVSLGVVAGGALNTFFGSSVASLNDVTGDGVPDAVVAEPRPGSSSTDHKVYRISGATRQVASGATIGHSFDDDGQTVAGIGDVDSDSYDDMLVLAAGNSFTPAFKIYSGDSLTLITSVCFASGTFPSCTGGGPDDASVLRLNDVNQDGVADFAVASATGGTVTGVVKIYSGADRSVHRTLGGRWQNDYFGYSLANMGDLDGDNADDILVGAVGDTGLTPHNGYVRAFSGRTGQVLFTIDDQAPNGQFGISVGNAGDLNGDGVNDVLVGENLYEPNTSTPKLGRVHVYFSPPNVAADQCIYQHIGNAIVCM